MKKISFLFGTFLVMALVACSQEKAKPEDTEVYTPVPPKVVPGEIKYEKPPSDAIILFDGKNLNEWVSNKDTTQAATWKIDGDVLTVNKQAGNIQTKRTFGNYQLHIEWRVPENITGKGQARGNSGCFLASIGKGDAGYELQIVDSYDNQTYTNGMAGSIYKQFVPLANPCRKPGEWNVYDVAWKAPEFNDDGGVKTPAMVTVFFNGVLVQDNTALLGPTQYIGKPSYSKKHGPSPIKLQAHGDESEPISFRNIWVRPS